MVKVIGMENELSFARKISFKPLLSSIFLGTMVEVMASVVFSKVILLAILCGILAMLIDSLVIYPRYLKELYGGWRIDQTGVYYVDYDSWLKRVALIYFPLHQKSIFVPPSAINSFKIVNGPVIINSQTVNGGILDVSQFCHEKYLVVFIDNGEVNLELTWDSQGKVSERKNIDRLITLLKHRCEMNNQLNSEN